MIIASVFHNGEAIRVEVVDVYQGSGRKLAAVRALAGEPFGWVNGGANSDRAVYPVAALHDIAVTVDLAVAVLEVAA